MKCIVYAINKYVSMSSCFQCLILMLVQWYPDVIGHSIRVALFERYQAEPAPEFLAHQVTPGVATKGGWLNLAYFSVAEMHMPLMHCYIDDFHPPHRSKRSSRKEK